MKIRVSSSLFSFYRRRCKLECGDSVLHASLHHILLNRGCVCVCVCVCVLEREMACIYSSIHIYQHTLGLSAERRSALTLLCSALC